MDGHGFRSYVGLPGSHSRSFDNMSVQLIQGVHHVHQDVVHFWHDVAVAT